jgi:hypothetical protein
MKTVMLWAAVWLVTKAVYAYSKQRMRSTRSYVSMLLLCWGAAAMLGMLLLWLPTAQACLASKMS